MNIVNNNAIIRDKGQITLTKDILEILGVCTGDKVTLIKQDNRVIMMNPAVYAMNVLQEGMIGEFEKANIFTDDDVMALVEEVRSEIEAR
ncbi:MAG: AbrB/MazE/SpoVT family DNA-binding domain-containing protein [Bacteroidales bacterium]|jgi:bifunctional DNA-binding transcriptional regulator/antitoxin component of YhaV-PrlF toxin-antitoxin module|nr:AbrB/MazE/SpoVT family DNA-binding domain-containing protein [Bacteroidales bacterium]